MYVQDNSHECLFIYDYCVHVTTTAVRRPGTSRARKLPTSLNWGCLGKVLSWKSCGSWRDRNSKHLLTHSEIYHVR